MAQERDVPEGGQLVRVRGQQWVVTDVRGSHQPQDELAASRIPGRTLVSLASVSDDDLGEELTVVWEVEPGRQVVPPTQLPAVSENGFDDPQALGAFLDAVRWGTIASADTRTLQAPFRSGITIEEYTSGTRFPGFFDLLIVDEAHHAAPAAPVKQHGYPKDSKQTEAVKRLAEHAQHRLFLSATPHNGYSWSWQALLEMLDPQRFFKGQEPDKKVLDQVMVRRLKTDIKNDDGTPASLGARSTRSRSTTPTPSARRMSCCRDTPPPAAPARTSCGPGLVTS